MYVCFGTRTHHFIMNYSLATETCQQHSTIEIERDQLKLSGNPTTDLKAKKTKSLNENHGAK